MAKIKTTYEGEALLGQGSWSNRESSVAYFGCTICYGAFPKTREGKKEAAKCCSEHKGGY